MSNKKRTRVNAVTKSHLNQIFQLKKVSPSITVEQLSEDVGLGKGTIQAILRGYYNHLYEGDSNKPDNLPMDRLHKYELPRKSDKYRRITPDLVREVKDMRNVTDLPYRVIAEKLNTNQSAVSRICNGQYDYLLKFSDKDLPEDKVINRDVPEQKIVNISPDAPEFKNPETTYPVVPVIKKTAKKVPRSKPVNQNPTKRSKKHRKVTITCKTSDGRLNFEQTIEFKGGSKVIESISCWFVSAMIDLRKVIRSTKKKESNKIATTK